MWLQGLPALPPAPHLRSAADCRAYIESLPGGAKCLERADELSRCIEASHPIDQVCSLLRITVTLRAYFVTWKASAGLTLIFHISPTSILCPPSHMSVWCPQDFYQWAANSMVEARGHLEEVLIASCCQGHVLTDWEGDCLLVPYQNTVHAGFPK